MDLRQINLFVPHGLRDGYQISGYFIEDKHNCLNIYLFNEISCILSRNPCCSEWYNLVNTHKLQQLVCNHELKAASNVSSECCIDINGDSILLNYLKINDNVFNISSLNIFILLYDYEAFIKSEDELINNCEDSVNQFVLLNTLAKHNNGPCLKKKYPKNEKHKNILQKYKIFLYISTLFRLMCKYSNLFVQLESFVLSIVWVFRRVLLEKMITVKTGNVITSLLVDFLCGLLVLYWINQLSITPVDDFYNLIEQIVYHLQSLLEWLMGFPAGLKLNHAFNTMLGKFFSYHIGLWEMFLGIIASFLETAFNIFQCIGMLGLTFQTAILTDLISLSSFHVYCIYTYAARLYNIQISGLIALWRLFLGRKHNPLRGGVDSCEYNHHQLFVGTIAFTILLFLLPTTFMYYVVFTTFRLVLVLLGGILTRLRYFLQYLPLYLVILWIFKSPRLAGKIHITTDSEISVPDNVVALKITLKTDTLFNLIAKYQPSLARKPDTIKWKQLFACLCHGHLLYPV